MPTLTIKSDKPVVVVPLDEYEALLETVEILSNPALKRDIEKARKEFREGKTIRLEKLRAELDED
jgi:PHD/YefM family antitoxin component YafN of YafNO toxin-antitoxin module